MLTFNQCWHIRKAGMNLRRLTKVARYRKLSAQELLETEAQLRRIEAWLNCHPTFLETLYCKAHRRYHKYRRKAKILMNYILRRKS